jgi:hypothetical protein
MHDKAVIKRSKALFFMGICEDFGAVADIT